MTAIPPAVSGATRDRERGEHEEAGRKPESAIADVSDGWGEVGEFGALYVVATALYPKAPVYAVPAPGQPTELRPSDPAFAGLGVPYHAAGLETADVALTRSDNPEVKCPARRIVTAQSRSVTPSHKNRAGLTYRG